MNQPNFQHFPGGPCNFPPPQNYPNQGYPPRAQPSSDPRHQWNAPAGYHNPGPPGYHNPNPPGPHPGYHHPNPFQHPPPHGAPPAGYPQTQNPFTVPSYHNGVPSAASHQPAPPPVDQLASIASKLRIPVGDVDKLTDAQVDTSTAISVDDRCFLRERKSKLNAAPSPPQMDALIAAKLQINISRLDQLKETDLGPLDLTERNYILDRNRKKTSHSIKKSKSSSNHKSGSSSHHKKKSTSSVPVSMPTTQPQVAASTASLVRFVSPKHLFVGGPEECNILVIGETGTGKSTAVNAVTNFYRSGSLTDIKVAIPSKAHPKVTEIGFKSKEHDIQNATTSKTDSCNTYRFPYRNCSMNWVDTPGLADSRGIGQDNENIAKILKAAERCKTLHAIIIVVNGRNVRITANISHTLTQLRGNIPDSALDNLVMLQTNCWKSSASFVPDVLGLKFSKIFYLDNTAISNDHRNAEGMEKKHIEESFDMIMQTIQELSDFILRLGPTTAGDFRKMRKLRMQIKAKLHVAQVKIQNLQKLHDEIAKAEAQLRHCRGDANAFSNYTRTVTRERVEVINVDYHSTICRSCNFMCHVRCGLDEISNAGDNAFKNCAAMSGHDHCGACPKKCSFKTHYHAKKEVRIVKVNVQQELSDIKAKYDAAQKGVSNAKMQINDVKGAKAVVAQAINDLSRSIQKECEELKAICSGFNFVDELNEMIKMLELEEKNLRTTDAKDTALMFIRALKAIANSLS